SPAKRGATRPSFFLGRCPPGAREGIEQAEGLAVGRSFGVAGRRRLGRTDRGAAPALRGAGRVARTARAGHATATGTTTPRGPPRQRIREIGRASCRERVEISVVAGAVKRKATGA